VLENKAVLEELLGHNLPEMPPVSRQAQYDHLADWLSENVNHTVFAAEYLKKN
jgi:hypothetical protein